jgi:hypothetical protein
MTTRTTMTSSTPWTFGKYALQRVALRYLSTLPSESDARAQARGEHIMEQASQRQDSTDSESASGEEKKPMRLRDVSVCVSISFFLICLFFPFQMVDWNSIH